MEARLSFVAKRETSCLVRHGVPDLGCPQIWIYRFHAESDGRPAKLIRSEFLAGTTPRTPGSPRTTNHQLHVFLLAPLNPKRLKTGADNRFGRNQPMGAPSFSPCQSRLTSHFSLLASLVRLCSCRVQRSGLLDHRRLLPDEAIECWTVETLDLQ